MVYSKRNPVVQKEVRQVEEEEEEEEEEEDVQMNPGPSQQQQQQVQNPQQRTAPNGRIQETFTFQALDWKSMLARFWVEQKAKINKTTAEDMRERCKHMSLPMARVKKIMRIDDEVRSLMIAADAPFFLAAAGEMFVEEVTSLAWQIVEVTRRRTMQKSDIVTALQKVEQFDFLIDIIPRDRSVRQTYTVPHPTPNTQPHPHPPKQYQAPSQIPPHRLLQQQQARPVNVQINQNTVPNGVNYEAPANGDPNNGQQQQNGEYMVENGYDQNVTAISIDEHGNPIGNLPPGCQVVVQNGNDPHQQQPMNQEYSTMQNGSPNDTGTAPVYTYNGQSYHIVHIADGSETPSHQYDNQ